jgi:DNA-directed RNA polymerase specialized sigma24 family protein
LPANAGQQQSRSYNEESLSENNPGPEKEAGAREELKAIEAQFCDDDEGLAVVMARAEGYSPEEIQKMFNLNPTQYDSTLKRIRRRLDQYKKKGAEQ